MAASLVLWSVCPAAARECAQASGDLPCVAEGYAKVLARAAALSTLKDLPADMRQPTAALLAEYRATSRFQLSGGPGAGHISVRSATRR